MTKKGVSVKLWKQANNSNPSWHENRYGVAAHLAEGGSIFVKCFDVEGFRTEQANIEVRNGKDILLFEGSFDDLTKVLLTGSEKL